MSKTFVEFHHRFGGEVSVIQELEDQIYKLPGWARPFYKIFLSYFIPWYRSIKVKQTMASVDNQIDKIDQSWRTEEDRIKEEEYQKKAEAIKVTLGEAASNVQVIKVQTPSGEGVHGILIEYKPTGGTGPASLLGGDMEIKSPYRE
jgi:hypothetical protein